MDESKSGMVEDPKDIPEQFAVAFGIVHEEFEATIARIRERGIEVIDWTGAVQYKAPDQSAVEGEEGGVVLDTLCRFPSLEDSGGDIKSLVMLAEMLVEHTMDWSVRIAQSYLDSVGITDQMVEAIRGLTAGLEDHNGPLH